MNTDINFLPPELRQRYLERRLQDVQDCFSRLSNRDWAYFEKLGHQLKGHAPSYGFDDLQEIALKIEVHAKEKDISNLQSCINDFKSWLSRHSDFAK